MPHLQWEPAVCAGRQGFETQDQPAISSGWHTCFSSFSVLAQSCSCCLVRPVSFTMTSKISVSTCTSPGGDQTLGPSLENLGQQSKFWHLSTGTKADHLHCMQSEHAAESLRHLCETPYLSSCQRGGQSEEPQMIQQTRI